MLLCAAWEKYHTFKILTCILKSEGSSMDNQDGILSDYLVINTKTLLCETTSTVREYEITTETVCLFCSDYITV